MNLAGFLTKTQVIKGIRAFFEEREFVEVPVPVFQTGLPLEPTIYGFETTWKTSYGEQTLYLSISPESSMKKVIAAGLSNVFAIGKCFRNLEGSGSRHNPEFTMLEWYRQDATWTDIMTQTQDLIRFVKSCVDNFNGRPYVREVAYQGETISLEGNWPRLSLVDLYQEHAGLTLSEIINDSELMTAAQKKGYNTDNATWEAIFDQIFLNEIEPHLPNSAFFLIDFPARLSPLCRPQAHRPYLAERFELYMGGMEIGNGNTEYLDADAVQASFVATQKERQAAHQPATKIDEDMIEAIRTLQTKGKSFAGIGLGVDRLAMIMANTNDISQVEPFTIKNPN